MFQKILIEMRDCVRNGRLTLPLHALDAMFDDGLLPSDLEHCILIGEITERQWDEVWQDWKYVIEGTCTDLRAIEVVARLGKNADTVVITVYRVY